MRKLPVVIPLALALALALAGCQSSPPNLAWEGDKTYVPPAAVTLDVAGFGVDAEVDVLPSGALPLTFQRQLTNTGNAAVAAGYDVTETVVRLAFQAAAGSAGFVAGDPALFTAIACTQPGPALPPGGSALITFTFPSATCAPGPALGTPPAPGLPCGLYLETLVADAAGVVAETDEGDNAAEHYFFVPSTSPQVNITTTLNPNNTPGLGVVPVQVVEVPVFNIPGPGPVTVTTHRVVIDTIPPGGQFTVNATPPQASRVGNVVALAPPPPPGLGGGPLALNLTLTFDPAALGPTPNRLDGLYEENFSVKVTAISSDGCLIRQEALKLRAIHEVRP